MAGVDISGDSLSIARTKAKKGGLNPTFMKFLEHDIAALDELNELEEGDFDVISCASAFVLFEDPENIVRGWKKMLKRGGKMIFDVPTWNRFVFSMSTSKGRKSVVYRCYPIRIVQIV